MPSIRKLSRNQLGNQPVLLATSPISYNPLPTTARRILTTSSPCNSRMSSLEETKAIWRMADAVCFDVDSTVCEDEAIDELAKFCGKEKEIAQITKNAMSGKMDFRSALRTRLNIIKPTFQQVQAYIEKNPPKLTSGIRELIGALHQRGVPVYLVSGGFRGIILEVAEELNIPAENVFANKLKFYFDGMYAGFDEDEPVSRSGGKAEVVKHLKEKHDYGNIVMIGDGATDLHTCPPADAFIGFGGNQVREEVKKHAKWFVLDFKELLQELELMPATRKTTWD